MTTYNGIETDLQSGLQQSVSLREPALRTPANPVGDQLPPQSRQPICMVPAGPASGSRMLRIITREQGRALESISHAVDYLQDSYLNEGSDQEFINTVSPATEAIQILTSLRQQMLQSMPLVKPLSQRLWNAVFHRKSPHKSQRNAVPVVRFSSR